MVRLETSRILMVVICFLGTEGMEEILRRAAGLLQSYASASCPSGWSSAIAGRTAKPSRVDE